MKCNKCGEKIPGGVPIHTLVHKYTTEAIHLCERHFREYTEWVEAFVANNTPDIIYNLEGAVDAALRSVERQEKKPTHLTLSGADYCDLKQEYNAGVCKWRGLPVDVDTTLVKGVFRVRWAYPEVFLMFPVPTHEVFVYLG